MDFTKKDDRPLLWLDFYDYLNIFFISPPDFLFHLIYVLFIFFIHGNIFFWIESDKFFNSHETLKGQSPLW